MQDAMPIKTVDKREILEIMKMFDGCAGGLENILDTGATCMEDLGRKLELRDLVCNPYELT